MTTYLLDTNVLITAKNLHYGFDICPGFWAWLDEAQAAGVVVSVQAVLEELGERADDLYSWADARRPMFLSPRAEDLTGLATANRWANESSHYSAAAKLEFQSVADSFVVGQALARGCTVVTHEKVSGSPNIIKVPDAALALNVPVVTPFQMLRAEHASFVLRKAS